MRSGISTRLSKVAIQERSKASIVMCEIGRGLCVWGGGGTKEVSCRYLAKALDYNIKEN